MADKRPNYKWITKITGSQIRAARGALNWTIGKLASMSGVGERTIRRYELIAGVPVSKKENLAKIKSAFEAVGVEFIGTPEDRPGIRIGSPK